MRISRERKIAHGRGFDPHLGHGIRYALVTQWSECGSYENLPVHDVVLLLGSAVWKRVIPSRCHPRAYTSCCTFAGYHGAVWKHIIGSHCHVPT